MITESLKPGDYINLKDVSDETLEKVRDKFVETGFKEGDKLDLRDPYNCYGVDPDCECRLYFYTEALYGENPNLLTVEQVLGSEDYCAIPNSYKVTDIEPVKFDTQMKIDDKAVMPKQERYKDNSGDDWIDEFARTATPEEFRGAMKFTIGKYNRRCGKKDDIKKEVYKIADYGQRWLAYEEGLDNE